jgi:hypothetical protein
MNASLRIAPLVLLAAACGEFIPNPLGPGSGIGNGDGGGEGSNPAVAVPFRVGGLQQDEGRGVVNVADGVIVASWFTGSVDFDPRATATIRNSFGAQDLAVAKYSTEGALQWVTTVGGAGGEVPNRMAATADGGAIVVGYGTSGTCGGRVLVPQGGRDILLVKIGPTGSCEWAQLLGGTQDDEARGVAVDVDGSIVVAGLFRGTVDFDQTGAAALLVSRGGTDAFLARFGADGSFLDRVQAGGLGDELFEDVVISDDGQITAAGSMQQTATFGSPLAPVVLVSSGGTDATLAQYSTFFGLRWATRFGGSSEDRATALALDGSGVTVAGTFEGTADLDPGAGAVLVVSRGGADLFLARYDVDTGAWAGVADAWGGTGSEGIRAIASNGGGVVLVTGWFQGSVDFAPGGGATVLTAKGTSGAGDAFVAAYAPGVGLAWVTPLGGVVAGDANLSIGNGVALDVDGTAWATGRFFGRADFDPLIAAVELTAAGSSDGYLTRYRVATGELVVTELPEPSNP